MRKLINSITKMKEYTSVGSNMQMMVDFTNYIGADKEFCTQLQAYAEKYFTARKANPRYNNSFGFEAEQSLAASDAEINEIREKMLADINSDSLFTTDIMETYLAETTIEIPEIPGPDFPVASGISVAQPAETLSHKACQPDSKTAENFPASGKSGHFLGKQKRPAFLKRNKKLPPAPSQPATIAA